MTPQESNRSTITFFHNYHATIIGSSLATLEPPKETSTVISTTLISPAKIHQGKGLGMRS